MGTDDYNALSAVRDGTEPESLEPSKPVDLSKPDPRYVQAWRAQRAWGRRYFGAFAVGIAGMLAQIAAGPPPALKSAGLVAFFGGCLFSVYSWHKWFGAACPRCSAAYAGGALGAVFSVPWIPAKCVRCGLPHGAARDPDAGGG